MIFWLLLASWLWFAAPSMHWLDTSELALASYSLGIGHPPGQIPHAVLGSGFAFFPWGDFSFRLALFSALACGFSLVLIRRWASVPKAWWAGGLLLVVGFSPLFATQALRCEVYGLALALTLGAIVLASDLSDPRKQKLAWFVWGGAMLTHPTIALGALPFLGRGKHGLGIVFLSMAGLALVYLPLRSWAHAPWDFGSPVYLERFFWYITGRLYSAYDAATWVNYVHNAGSVLKMILEMLSPLGFALALGGLWVTGKKDRRLLLTSLVSLVLFLLPLLLRGHFWRTNPDLGGYLLPTAALLLGFALRGAAWCAERWRVAPLVLNVGVTLWVILHGLGLGVEASLRQDFSARNHMSLLMSEPWAYAEVSTGSFSTYSFMRYGQVVEGRRPDLRVTYRGLPESVSSEVGEGRPLFWELALERNRGHRYALREEEGRPESRLVPYGWFFKMGGPSPAGWRAEWKRRNQLVLASMKPALGYPQEPVISNYLAHYLQAMRRDPHDAAVIWQEIQELFPGLEGLEELEVSR